MVSLRDRLQVINQRLTRLRLILVVNLLLRVRMICRLRYSLYNHSHALNLIQDMNIQSLKYNGIAREIFTAVLEIKPSDYGIPHPDIIPEPSPDILNGFGTSV